MLSTAALSGADLPLSSSEQRLCYGAAKPLSKGRNIFLLALKFAFKIVLSCYDCKAPSEPGQLH